MPERYRGMSMPDIYDDLGASPRYPAEVLDISIFNVSTDDKVQCHVDDRGRDIVRTYRTPRGSLREVIRKGSMGSGGYHTEYPVKTTEDMRVMSYILDHTTFSFDRDAFEKAERLFGPRGVTQSYYPRAPLQRLVIAYMGVQNTVYALTDYRRETEEFMEAIAQWDDSMYEVLLDCPVKILNFGENIDSRIDSPRYYENYLLPYYKKRVKQVHQSGKFCHIHMDGALKPLLPLINEAGFDGIEAATPLPQGDVTLEELKEALGDTILLDGIPAILFLPQYSMEQLEACALEVLRLFSPNVILGVSDELPPPADIERVRMVSKLVEAYEP